MPIFFQQEVDNDTRLAVWQITEDEAFFDVPLQRAITHPHKRLQHRAGRYLLRHLFPDFPLELIQVADTRKPYLDGEPFHFSLSHAGDFAAAIVSRNLRVGVDVELFSDKVQRIRPKFIGPVEELRLAELEEDLDPVFSATMIWSAKEAAFKWYGHGNVDFRQDMAAHVVLQDGPGSFITGLHFGKEIGRTLAARSRFFRHVCLSYIAED